MLFALDLARAPRTRRRNATVPLRILVIGNLSGGSGAPLAERRALPVDIDSLEPVCTRLAPGVTLDLGTGPVTIEFRSLDGFHPDRLWERLPLFRALRQLRGELMDPAQFRRAAAALGTGAAPQAEPAPVATDAAADVERLLGRAPAPQVGPAEPDLAGWLRALVAPHVVPDIAAEQAALVAAVDAVIAEQMRAILHHPQFQALEALWRGIDRLVRELELGESLQLWLLDAARADLTEDLRLHAADLTRSALHRHLSEPATGAPDGEGWSLLVSDLGFGPDPDDLGLLAGLGALAGRAGTPLLAAATPALLGCTAPAELTDPHAWRPLPDESAAFWGALRASSHPGSGSHSRGCWHACPTARRATRSRLSRSRNRNRNAARVLAFQSIAEPPSALAGAWAVN